MHPIGILEGLVGLIPVFQRLSLEKLLQELNPMKFLCFSSIPKEALGLKSIQGVHRGKSGGGTS
jgi:hypothetical protein